MKSLATALQADFLDLRSEFFQRENLEPIKYLSEETAPLYEQKTGTKKFPELLCGDYLNVLQTGASLAKVKASGMTGFVSNSAIDKESLFELHFIDVGQGDEG